MPLTSFLCLTALARMSITMLNKSSESGNPCSLLDLKGKAFSIIPLSILLTIDFFYSFLKNFNMNDRKQKAYKLERKKICPYLQMT